MASVDQLINAYIQVRDQKKELTDRHKQEVAPFNEKLATLEAGLLKVLNTVGGDNIKTAHGTVFKKTRRTYRLPDWDATLQYLLDNHLEHMLVRKLTPSALDEYVEANGNLPPGVDVDTETVINVRRS